MQYDKTVTDTYDDTARVEVSEIYGEPDEDTRVYLTVNDTSGMGDRGESQMAFTPAQARLLARALKRAANVAEGKPAKTPKSDPEIYEDRDGYLWYRGPNGLYKCGVEFPEYTWTFAAVKETYGIREERPDFIKSLVMVRSLYGIQDEG